MMMIGCIMRFIAMIWVISYALITHSLHTVLMCHHAAGEGAWHRLDNVGSIMCFVIFFVYLMDWRDYFTGEMINSMQSTYFRENLNPKNTSLKISPHPTTSCPASRNMGFSRGMVEAVA